MDHKQAQDARFVEALQCHRAAMFRVARTMLRSNADAEDAVSAATLAAYQHLHALRSWDSVRPWLMRITIRAGQDILRAHRRELPTDLSQRPETPAPPQPTPLWMYLEQLPPQYRLPLAMFYGEGMSLREISQALRLPKGTVSARITRGRQALKQQLEQEAIDP